MGNVDGKMDNEVFADDVRVFLVWQEFLKEAKQLSDVHEELWKMQKLLRKEGYLFADIHELLVDILEDVRNVQNLFRNTQDLLSKEEKLFTDIPDLLTGVLEEILNVQNLFRNIRNLFSKKEKLFSDIPDLLRKVQKLLRKERK